MTRESVAVAVSKPASSETRQECIFAVAVKWVTNLGEKMKW